MTTGAPSPEVAAWRRRGQVRELAGHRVFTIDLAPTIEVAEPLLVVHGFPTSSHDFHLVVDRLAADRRVLLLDLVGFGLSAKPDLAYSVDLHADVVAAFVGDLGLTRLSLLTHDLGDTVGGELLARQAEGRWPVEIAQRVLTNGSIYLELAHLSAGQELLLSLPDQPLVAGPGRPGLVGSLAATMAPGAERARAVLEREVELIELEGGDRLLPRTIRYIEERRRHERRFTGAIEVHPSPLGVVWGLEDPIARAPMVDRLLAARPGTPVRRLDGVGHYPMLEAPARFAEAVASLLAEAG